MKYKTLNSNGDFAIYMQNIYEIVDLTPEKTYNPNGF